MSRDRSDNEVGNGHLANIRSDSDWVAVDHWNTDNPGTHLVLDDRDVAGSASSLQVIYMAKGMLTRVAELALERLRHTTDLEIQQSLRYPVVQERWTSLDRELKQRSVNGRLISVQATKRPARRVVERHSSSV